MSDKEKILYTITDEAPALATHSLDVWGFAGQVLGWSIVTAVVVLPAAIVAGVQFPMLVGLLGQGRENVGREVGQAYGWNTGGAILGSLATGTLMLQFLGVTALSARDAAYPIRAT